MDGILAQHDYPPAVEALVAEMALLTALIGQTIKLRWKLSLQVQSKGAVRMIATDYYGPTTDGEPARIRAYASYDGGSADEFQPFDQVGRGYFAIMIDQGEGMTPYQGITPLEGGSLAACGRPILRSPSSCRPAFRSALAGHPAHPRLSIGVQAASCCSTCRRRRP